MSVRAGSFERCVRGRELATICLFADPVAAWRAVQPKTTERYRPGPGLVKLVREEAIASRSLFGGILIKDLPAWQ